MDRINFVQMLSNNIYKLFIANVFRKSLAKATQFIQCIFPVYLVQKYLFKCINFIRNLNDIWF